MDKGLLTTCKRYYFFSWQVWDLGNAEDTVHYDEWDLKNNGLRILFVFPRSRTYLHPI